MAYRYTVDKIPPSNNKNQGTGNRWNYQKDKKEWAWLVKAAVGRNKPTEPIDKTIVLIKYYFKDKRRRDPDNYSGKFILDGLVRSGVIKDDSFKNIKLLLDADVDREYPRTEIKVLSDRKQIEKVLEILEKIFDNTEEV